METDVARPLRVALAQIDTTVGDLPANTARMVEWVDRARSEGCDMVVFPELALTGYPPEDLLLKPSFIRDNLRYRDRVATASRGIAVVGGFVDLDGDIYNAAFFAYDGELRGVYHKVYLPNYGVFDEERYFQRGRRCPIFELAGVRIGVSICEDAWYPTGPISLQAAQGAELLININGSPYHRGKRAARETMIATRAMDSRAFLVWVNLVGGQDELVFDGNSLVFNPEGRLKAHARSFEEELLIADLDIGSVFGERLHDTRLRKEASIPVQFDLDVTEVTISQDELVFDGNSLVFDPEGRLKAHARSFEEELLIADLDIGSVFGERLHDTRLRKEASIPVQFDLDVTEVTISEEPSPRPAGRRQNPLAAALDGPAEVYTALVTGTRDYVLKSGKFEKVVLGLSGGIDSSLTACVAVDALGRDNVVGVLMPSRFTSRESLEDACLLAEALGIRTYELPIESVREAYLEALSGAFQGTEPGVAEENIQARIRGNLEMALSNKFGWMVLTTGNKSELATGYTTLYGDMAGGFGVLKDIPKTTVYELSRYRNTLDGAPIPERVLSKPPSAELRENQRDQDSLPPYEELDPILQGYVEDDRSFEELVAAGHDPATVRRVIGLVDANEYKRRQAPPGVKITPRAFGRDRRMPITNRYLPDGVRRRDEAEPDRR